MHGLWWRIPHSDGSLIKLKHPIIWWIPVLMVYDMMDPLARSPQMPAARGLNSRPEQTHRPEGTLHGRRLLSARDGLPQGAPAECGISWQCDFWLVAYLPLWKIWGRQLGWLFLTYGKIKKCWNHQPDLILDLLKGSPKNKNIGGCSIGKIKNHLKQTQGMGCTWDTMGGITY